MGKKEKCLEYKHLELIEELRDALEGYISLLEGFEEYNYCGRDMEELNLLLAKANIKLA